MGVLEGVDEIGQRPAVDPPPALGGRDRETDRRVRLAAAGRTRDVVLTNPALSSVIRGTRCAVVSWRSAGATSGEVWLGMQMAYDLWQARDRAGEIAVARFAVA